MKWKFWTGNREIKKQVRRSVSLVRRKISEQIQDLHNEVKGTTEDVKEKFDSLIEKFSGLNEDFTDFAKKLQQLRRLHYKNDREIQNKLDNLIEKLDNYSDIKKQYEKLEKEHSQTGKRLETMIDATIGWIDKIDRVRRGIDSEEENWNSLLKQWSEKALKKLAEINIYELILEDEIFDPRFAEAMETVGPDDVEEEDEYKQYQIVEVMTRAFVHKNGDIKRKARVITYREENKKNDDRKRKEELQAYSWN